MAKNLKLGSRFIRLALISGVLISIGGAYCSIVISSDPATAVSLRKLANLAIIGSVLNALIMLIIFIMLATRNMVKRVGIIAAAMDRGAEGDLTPRVDESSADELGMLGSTFNGMLQKLSGMAKKVSLSINELQQISASLKEVSARSLAAVEVNSEGVEETSGAVQEINHSVHDVAQAVDSLSRSAAENASAIQEMSASITEVTDHVRSLAKAVEEVSSSIMQMAAAEKQIGNSVNSLMEDSTATASLVAQMDSSIKQVEHNAQQTVAISENVKTDAEAGRETVEATISGIGEIRRSSRITFEAIQNLSTRAGDIGKILSVIDDVADQTNLLSLNASIIAAQAGESGKGFAVVAEEIKELSKRTSHSIQEITDIIKGVQEETQRAVKAINVSEQRIAEGELLSQRSGQALQKIVQGVQMATEQVGSIAQTTVEQALGSQNMRKAMERVAEMVSHIAKATRDQGHGSEQIMAAVNRMQNLTEQVQMTSREQSSSSQMIVQSTEDISAMIGNIRHACTIQAECGRKIVHAVEQIQDSTHVSVESTRVMDGAVSGLSTQTELLRKEMSWFKA
jgi:methyl-accepting chemotaxis protein